MWKQFFREKHPAHINNTNFAASVRSNNHEQGQKMKVFTEILLFV